MICSQQIIFSMTNTDAYMQYLQHTPLCHTPHHTPGKLQNPYHTQQGLYKGLNMILYVSMNCKKKSVQIWTLDCKPFPEEAKKHLFVFMKIYYLFHSCIYLLSSRSMEKMLCFRQIILDSKALGLTTEARPRTPGPAVLQFLLAWLLQSSSTHLYKLKFGFFNAQILFKLHCL